MINRIKCFFGFHDIRQLHWDGSMFNYIYCTRPRCHYSWRFWV